MRIGKKIITAISWIFAVGITSTAVASPQKLTYQGRIVNSQGNPLNYNDVSFRFQITSTDGTCVLYYEERQHVNMQNSDGIFDIAIGDGTVIYAVGGSNKLSDSFINGISYNCYGGGTWNAASTSERLLKVAFHDGTGWQAIDPANTIRSVPFAMSSYSAQTLTDKTINDLVLKASLTSCSAGQALSWNGTTFSCVATSTGSITGVTAGSGLSGGGTSGTVTVSLANTSVTAGTYGSATSVPVFTVDAQGRVTGVTPTTITGAAPTGSASGDLSGTYPGPTIANSAVTSAKIADGTIVSSDLDFTGTNVATSTLVVKDSTGKFAEFACSTVGHVATWTSVGWGCQAPSTTDATKLPLAGGTMAGAIDMNTNNMTNIGYMTMSSGKSLHVSNNASDPSLVAADKGKIWFNSTSNELKYWNGTSAVAVGSTGAAITALTGDVTASGPGSSPATIASGAVTSSKIASGTIVGSNIDFSGTNASTANLVIKDSAGKFANFGCSTTGHVATWSATGWSCSAPSPLLPTLNNGTMWIGNGSNVATAVTMSGDATISNAGALTLKNTGTAGTYYSVTTDAQGRVTAGAASLVAADIPNLDWAKITSAKPTTLTGYGITDSVQNGGGTPSVTTGLDASKPAAAIAGRIYVATDTQKIYSDSGSVWTVVGANTAITGANGAFINGGNSFGTVGTLGTNDNYNLALKTNGTNRVIIDTAGNVGIGGSPAYKAHIRNGVLAVKGDSGTSNAPSTESVASFDREAVGGVGVNMYTMNSQPANFYFGNTSSPQQGSIKYQVDDFTPANQYMAFRVNSAERVRINSAGKVGIGTSSPTSQLHVAGSMTDTSGTPALNFFYGTAEPTAASTGVFYGSNGSVAKFDNAYMSGAQTIGTAGIVEQGGTGTLGTATGVEGFVTKYGLGNVSNSNGVLSHIKSSSTGTIGSFSGLRVATDISSGTLTNAYGVNIEALQGTNRWGIYQQGSSDKNYFAGSVGIGVASPSYKLDVDGDINITGNFKVNGTNIATGGGTISALTGDVTASGTGSVAATIANSAVTNAKLANMASYTLKGNNTGSAAGPIDVTIASLQGTGANSFAAGNDARITGAMQSGASAGGDLTGTYPNPTIAAGAVTTGKIASATILGTNMNFTGVNAGTSNMVIKDSTGKFYEFGCSTAGHVATWTVSGWACQAVTVTPSSFGSQTQKTFLAAPTGADGNPTFRTIASTDLPTSVYVNGGNSFGSAATIGTADANNLTINTNGSARMTFLSTGKVGIGPTSPAYPLEVSGGTTGDYTKSTISTDSSISLGGFDFASVTGKGLLLAKVYDGGGVHKGYVYFSTPSGNGAAVTLRTADQTKSGSMQMINSDGHISFQTNNTERLGIGYSNTITASTAVVGTPSTVAAAAVDLATSNTHTLASVGGSAITLTNMANGGHYTLVVTDTTSRTYTFSGCNTSKYSPSNQATVAGTPSIYSIITIYNGSTYDCYITWSTGYN